MPRGRPRIHITSIMCPDCGGKKYQYANLCNQCKFKGSRNPMYGRSHTEETRRKCSENASRPNLGKFGPDHPSWKEDTTNYQTGRSRAETLYPPKPCEICGGSAERHHIDENPLNNAPANIAFLCRRHHKHVHYGRISLNDIARRMIGAGE